MVMIHRRESGPHDTAIEICCRGILREEVRRGDSAAEKGILCDNELTPIQKVNEAFKRTVQADVKFRFVIDMASLQER